MTLTDAEREAVWQAFSDGYAASATWDGDDMRLVVETPLLSAMTRAVELVASRVGTMTAEGLTDAMAELRQTAENTEYLEAVREADLLRLWQVGQHIAAQGARLAVAEQERDTARLAIAAGNGMLVDARLEVVRLKAQVEALQAAGAVLSAHVDKTAGEVAPLILDGSGAALVLSPDDPPRFVACTKHGPSSVLNAFDLLSPEGADINEDLALTKGYDDGIEAMRAACITAVREVYNSCGGCVSMNDLKAAIEGAAP